jgi:hypothetical protein
MPMPFNPRFTSVPLCGFFACFFTNSVNLPVLLFGKYLQVVDGIVSWILVLVVDVHADWYWSEVINPYLLVEPLSQTPAATREVPSEVPSI